MSGLDSIKAESQSRCAEEIKALDSSHRREVMAQLCFDRIAQKQEFLLEKYHDTEDWTQTAYFMLLRSLDIKANRVCYERLAHLLPYHYLQKASLERRSVEAMLLGCSGLLSRLVAMSAGNAELAELQSIFEYDSHKYGLEQMRADEWQLIGHIGDNHPVVRLLQLASLLSQHNHLMSDILDCRTKGDVERMFCNTSVPKWAYRLLAEEEGRGAISRTKAQMLGINVVAQLQILYSEYTMRQDLDTRGIDLLERLPAESNMFVARWGKLGVKAANALESQALLQLTKEYCSLLRCDKCLFRRFVDAE